MDDAKEAEIGQKQDEIEIRETSIQGNLDKKNLLVSSLSGKLQNEFIGEAKNPAVMTSQGRQVTRQGVIEGMESELQTRTRPVGNWDDTKVDIPAKAPRVLPQDDDLAMDDSVLGSDVVLAEFSEEQSKLFTADLQPKKPLKVFWCS